MNKQYKAVVFDIDNTLTDLSFVLDTMATLHHKSRIPIDDVLSFRLAEAFNLSDEEESTFWEKYERNIIAHSPLAVTRLDNLLKQFVLEDTQIHLVSNRAEEYLLETKIWAEIEGLPFDSIHCIGKQDKALWIHTHMPEAEAVFEDNPYFFTAATDFGFDTYCIDYPYNKNSLSTYRINRDNGLLMTQ